MWQGLLLGGGGELGDGWCRGVLCENRPGLPLCRTESVPASSKVGPLLVKADPTSKAGGASLKTYLRKGKICCTAAVRVRSEAWQKMWNNPAGSKASKEGEEEALQVLEQRFSATLWCGTWQRRLYPCIPWRNTVEQISTLQLCEYPRLEQVGMSWRNLQATESPGYSRISGSSCGPWATRTGADCSWRIVPCGKNPFWTSSWVTSGIGKTHTGAVCEGLCAVRETSHWSRGTEWGVRSSGADHNHHPPEPFGVGKGRIIRSGGKSSLGRKDCEVKVYLVLSFSLHLTLFLIVSHLVVIGGWSPHPYQLMSFSILFCLPVLLRRGSEERFGGHLAAT